MDIKELVPSALTKKCNLRLLPFENTSEVEPLKGMIGQERVMKAMEFGLHIKSFGYNIYMSGAPGTGKISYAKEIITERAANEPTPDDICYAYNFLYPDQPIMLSFPAGTGHLFVVDIEELVKDLKNEIPRVFASSDYEKQKQRILEKFKQDRDGMLEKLNQLAAENNFIIKWTNTGFMSVPLIDGKAINEQDYLSLEEDVRKVVDRKSELVNKHALDVMKKIIKREKKLKNEIDSLDEKTALFIVDNRVSDIKATYAENIQAIDYLDALKNDIVMNLQLFKDVDEEKQDLPAFLQPNKDAVFTKYKINLIVDNSNLKGAPVIVETNPTYYNLIGRVEYENNMGVATTNFMKIKAGALHKANGGYLVIEVKDLLMNPQAYEVLKRSIKNEVITIEALGDQMGIIATSSLRPEPVPLKTKIIVVGSPHIYQVLFHYDEDFNELFKIKADFNALMDFNPENVKKMSQFIASHCIQEKLKHFDKKAVGRIIEFSCKLAGSQDKLITRFNEIVEMLHEANAFCEKDKLKFVQRKHIDMAYKERIHRLNKYEEMIDEMHDKGTLMIETSGEAIGQINGLSVLSLGDYTFGKPSKITVNTWAGKRGIVNIEREIDMSGKTHSKGVLILSSFFGEKFAQKCSLSFSASICFEQLYDGVDGDSASSTELYALLSSLTGLPIRQSLAVTGSVNQKGEIQPIGGVNYKIEGFYRLCKKRGLDGSHGVMIPEQNVTDLMLEEEIVNAVRNGKFHIYPIKTIKEGIELLTGIPAGTVNENGKSDSETVFGKVITKLKEYEKVTAPKQNKKIEKDKKNKKDGQNDDTDN